MFREFKDIVSYIRNNESGIAGDIYVGSRFLIARNCNPFFKAAFEKERPVKANVVCLVIVRRGWCEPVIGLKKYRCTAWKSHTNLTHPGKYFRPSKVKIMRPTSPK